MLRIFFPVTSYGSSVKQVVNKNTVNCNDVRLIVKDFQKLDALLSSTSAVLKQAKLIQAGLRRFGPISAGVRWTTYTRLYLTLVLDISWLKRTCNAIENNLLKLSMKVLFCTESPLPALVISGTMVVDAGSTLLQHII